MNSKKTNFSALAIPVVAVAIFALNGYGNTEKTEADNSKMNKRDRSVTEVTAENQGNSEEDIALTSKIRKEVTDRDNLSINAQNIKIITDKGKVTLKGPVESAAEKKEIEQIATRIAGASKVISLIEVKTQ
jgi:hyperosmotically inducible periplasmic protein